MGKYKKAVKIIVLFVGIFIAGCTNGDIYSSTNSMGTTSAVSYNRAAAAILYAAYPELIAGTGISKTRTNTKRSSTTVSNSVSSSQSFGGMTNSQRVTSSKTHSKSKSTSVTTGIRGFSGFDF